MKLLYSRCRVHPLSRVSLAFHFHFFSFFFQPATDLHPPLPLPPPNNNNSFLCNNNVPPYSVEARRNVPDVSVELELIWLGESSERVAQMRSRM